MDQKWTLKMLEQVVSAKTTESLTMEFKASGALDNADAKKNEISKDVSSLANSAGGTIIYGMEEDGHCASGLDNGVDLKLYPKEWLENIVISRIHRRVDNVKIWQVPAKTAGRGYFVVEIPQSTRAPHQASDKRFYKRHNFQSVPMEEYEIRDIALRGSAPDLEIYFSWSTQSRAIGEGQTRNSFTLRPQITNNSDQPAKYAHLQIGFDSRLELVGQSGGFKEQKGLRIDVGGLLVQVDLFSKNWSIPGKMPIYKGVDYSLTDNGFEFYNPKEDGEYLVYSKSTAPSMEQKAQFYLVQVKDSNVSFDGKALTLEETTRNRNLPWQES